MKHRYRYQVQLHMGAKSNIRRVYAYHQSVCAEKTQDYVGLIITCCYPCSSHLSWDLSRAKASVAFPCPEGCARAADLGSFILLTKTPQPVQFGQDLFPEIRSVLLP